MIVEGWMIGLIAVFGIPAALSTLNRKDGNFDMNVMLISSAILIIYAIWIGLFPAYVLILPILFMGMLLFRPTGDAE